MARGKHTAKRSYARNAVYAVMAMFIVMALAAFAALFVLQGVPNAAGYAEDTAVEESSNTANDTPGPYMNSSEEGEQASAAAQGQMPVTVNGQEVLVPANAQVHLALQAANVQAQPGNRLAVDGSILELGAGIPDTIRVNGADAHVYTQLASGDEVVFEAGGDATEPLEYAAFPGVASVSDDASTGAFNHLVYNGDAAYGTVAIGGQTKLQMVNEWPESLVPATLTSYNVNPPEKLIALTFDDGPNTEYTPQILDILAENDAHATFFVVGNCFDGRPDETAVLQRAYAEGHQICTHTYTHAANATDFKMGNLSAEEQVSEVVKGQAAIARALGIPVSTTARMPTGSYTADVAQNLSPYISLEVGWTSNTYDFNEPGSDAIAQVILGSEPGEVILMHDGGGDRSQTVEALRQALPVLREAGWRFVTIDELLAA